ncbi:MAG: hypothetical protein GF308_19110 [Candidatus Heimdallarchaeota archaeon]|nr:hypothetical protein [Candidatus Heimdallarchaeota archaeon]
MLEGLDTTNWEELTHAYGEASDVPELIRALTSKRPKVRKKAQWRLYGNLFHQHKVYEATAVAVPFFYELLEMPKVKDKAWIIEYLLNLALGNPKIYLPYGGPNVEGWKKSLKREKERKGRGEFDRTIMGEEFDKQMQKNLIANITNGIKCYKAVQKELPNLYPFLEAKNEKIRIMTVYFLAWFRENAETSLEKVRLLRTKETSANSIANAIISSALLASYLNETKDKELFEGYLKEEYPIIVRTAAAIGLATILKEGVKKEVIATLIDSLLTFSNDKKSKKRLKSKIIFHWKGGDILGYISEILSYCGFNQPELVLPPIVKVLGKLNTYQALTITHAALNIAFQGKTPKGNKWTLEEIDKYPLMVLEVLAEEPNLWGKDGSIFVNFSNLLRGWGLPANREDLKKFLKK